MAAPSQPISAIALPERGGMAFAAFEHVAHDLRRRLFGQEAARLVAQLLQVVGEVEVHGAGPFAGLGQPTTADVLREASAWRR